MQTYITILQVVFGLIAVGIFFTALIAAMVRERSWPRTLLWMLISVGIAPPLALIGYGLGALYSVEDGHQAGLLGFGGAGLIIGLFLFLNRATSTQWYKKRTQSNAKDFPVTARIVICIAAAALAAMIVAAPLFLFPLPIGVQRLILCGPFLTSWVGLFVGCAVESRARSRDAEDTSDSDSQ